MFAAGMFLPIVPTDMGVSLSPFLRKLVDPNYNRNLFDWGFLYTVSDWLPSVIREQSKPGSMTQQSDLSLAPGAVRGLQRNFPLNLALSPTNSQVNAAAQSIAGPNPVPAPEAPPQKFP
jgi:hypothetical protein